MHSAGAARGLRGSFSAGFRCFPHGRLVGHKVLQVYCAVATAVVGPSMISFNSASNKNKDPDKEARLAGIRQISDWVENELPEDEQETTSVMVNQIECAEEGCPPVECVIALLRKPKLVFKVFTGPALSRVAAAGSTHQAAANHHRRRLCRFSSRWSR